MYISGFEETIFVLGVLKSGEATSTCLEYVVLLLETAALLICTLSRSQPERL